MNELANRKVWRLQEEVAKLPQIELPTFHAFADGMYARIVKRPAGTVIVGKVHKREHFYIVTKGRVKVWPDEQIYEAGAVVVSQPGTKRAVYALEDSICMTVHRTDKRDLDEIERELIEEDESALLDSGNTLKDRDDYERILVETGYTLAERRTISENPEDQIPMPRGFAVAFLPSQIEGTGAFAMSVFLTGDVIAPARIGDKRTPVGRYTNHSTTPNARMERDGDRINVVALRDIEYNEEITVSYRQAMKAAQ